MKKVCWEVCVILKENNPIRGNIELIPCNDKRTAIRIANRIKEHKYDFCYDYEAIYVQANNGSELLDDHEIKIT